MAPRLIIHIGAHKTGTSFVQRMFHHNQALLAQHGVYYPDIGPNPAHHILASPWIDVPDIAPEFFHDGGPDGVWRRFLRDCTRWDGTVFLSAELFSRAEPNRIDMADLARRVAGFEDMRIVYTIRHQAALIQSIWLQRAKGGNPPNLERFLNHALTAHLASGIWVEHGKVLDHIETGFSPAQITVLDYDVIRQKPDGVLGAFLNLTGAPLKPSALASIPDNQANISPDALSMYLASRISSPTPPTPGLLAQTRAAVLGEGKARTSLFSRDETARINKVFAPFNAALANRLRATQPDFELAKTPDDDGPLLYRDDVTPQKVQALARNLFRSGRQNNSESEKN